MTQNENLYVYHHLGLGDHIICNGLVRYIVKNFGYKNIYLVVKKSNVKNIKRMFVDLPEVHFYEVEKDSDFTIDNYPVLRIGFENANPMQFDKSFYDCAKIPFSERWDSWHIKEDKHKENIMKSYLNIQENYIFVHDKSSTGEYNLNIESSFRQIKPDKIACEDSVFDWVPIIAGAKEVHAINSSFVHLIDSIKTNAKLFYHDIKPNTVGFSLKKNWQIINY